MECLSAGSQFSCASVQLRSTVLQILRAAVRLADTFRIFLHTFIQASGTFIKLRHALIQILRPFGQLRGCGLQLVHILRDLIQITSGIEQPQHLIQRIIQDKRHVHLHREVLNVGLDLHGLWYVQLLESKILVLLQLQAVLQTRKCKPHDGYIAVFIQHLAAGYGYIGRAAVRKQAA